MASEEYKESDLSKIVKRLMDEEGFEFGEAVKEAMEQTKNFESKADGGSIGIEVLFQPKREKFNTGGIGVGGSTSLASLQRQGYQLQNTPTKRSYDSRATTQDYTNALKNVSAGTTYQQQADSKRYARQEANRMLTDAFRSGNQQGLQNLYNQFGFNTTAPGSQLFSRGTTSGTLNQIIGLPAAKRDRVLDQMAQKMLSFPTGGSSAPPKKSPLQLKIEENQRLFNEYVKNNPPLTGIITGPKGGTPTSPGLPPYLDKNLLSQLTMLTPEEAFAGETFDTLSDLDQYNFAQAFSQFKPQLRDPTYVSPYGIDDQQIFSRRYGIKDGGRVRAVSGGFLKLLAEGTAKGKKGIMELVESGKGRFDEFVETMNQNKKPSESFTSQNITADLIDGPITVEKMANLDSKTLNIIKNTYDNGLYKEMPEILKAGNLLERFTKVVKGERIVDYERAESILGVPLKGDETLNEIFKIEFDTRPVEKLADGGRVGLFMGGDPLTGQALAIYDSMKAYNFSDQEIANALSARGLSELGTSNTPETTSSQTIGYQNNSGNGDGKTTSIAPGTLKSQYQTSINNPINNAIYDFKENMTTKLSDPNTKMGKLGINTSNILGSAIGLAAGIPGLGFVLDKLSAGSEFDRGAIRELNAPMQLGIYNKDRTGTGYFSQGPVQPGISSLSDTYKSGLTDGQFAGVTVDDLGRIQQTGDYNTAENVMAGYNAGFDLGGTAFDRYDKIDDTIEKEKEKELVDYAKIKSLEKRQKALTDFALANAAAQRAAKQAAIDRAIARGNKAAEERARVKSITAGYGGHDESPGATGPTAAGAGMGVGGGYASDYGFLKDGGIAQDAPKGLATMFTRRR